MNTRLSIFQKGLLLISIPVTAQVVFLVVLQLARTDQEKAQELALHTKDVIVQAETSHRLVFEANGYMRFFVMTSSDHFAKKYRKIRDRIKPSYDVLCDLVVDNPTQKSKSEELANLVTQFIAWMDENVRLVESGKGTEAILRLENFTGMQYLETIRGITDAFLKSEEELDQDRLRDLHQSSRWQNTVLFVGIFLTLTSAGGLLIVFSRGIARRINILIGNTRRMVDGKELAPRLEGYDELSALDNLFHEMAGALRHKDQENEMFVYSVSHDLRTPLVNLQGFSKELDVVLKEIRKLIEETALPEPLQKRSSTLLDRNAAESIHFIQTAVTRLAGIIDALLRLSRVGRVEYRLQNVDMQSVVERVTHSLHGTILSQGASVVLRPLTPAWGDPTALDQVFGNLLNNALNYLDPSRPGEIEIGSLEKSNAAPGLNVYYVKDNGLGIPEALQEKVFIAFQRLHPNTTPGEGIGLALVRRVVERHGGKVWLESQPGKGSTFFLALPPAHP